MGGRSRAVGVVAGTTITVLLAGAMALAQGGDDAPVPTPQPSVSSAPSPSPAKPVGALAFANDKTLGLSWKVLEEGITFEICNVGKADVSAGWRLLPLDLDLRADGRYVETSDVLNVHPPGVGGELNPYECDEIRLSRNDYEDDIDVGTYTAALTVVSPEAGEAAREISLEIPEDGTASKLESATEITLRWLRILAPPILLLLIAALLIARIPDLRSWGRESAQNNWFWRFLFAPQIGIEKFEPAQKDDDRLDPIAAVFRDAFAQCKPGSDTGVDYYADTGDTIADLSDALKELPHGKVVASALLLLQRLLPRTLYRIHGTLLPAGERGPGIALHILRGRARGVSSITVWEADYLPPFDDIDHLSTLFLLANVGAVWARYTIVEDLLGEIPSQELGSVDWESNAYSRLGTLAWMRNYEAQGEFFFARSVDRDPTNLIAMFNLAFSDNRLGEFEQAEARLQTLWTRIQ